jgi:hypothetical protein
MFDGKFVTKTGGASILFRLQAIAPKSTESLVVSIILIKCILKSVATVGAVQRFFTLILTLYFPSGSGV